MDWSNYLKHGYSEDWVEGGERYPNSTHPHLEIEQGLWYCPLDGFLIVKQGCPLLDYEVNGGKHDRDTVAAALLLAFRDVHPTWTVRAIGWE